jgi:hypothetical protein
MVRVALVLVLLAGVAAARPPMRRLAERHFDHAAHTAALGGNDITCARCHPTTGAAGRLTDTGTNAAVDHAMCEGSGCHGTSFAKDTRCDAIKASKLERVCGTCHIKDTCFPPPPAAVPRLQASFGHARHAALGPSIEGDCAQCHTAEAGGSGGDGHRACSGCHERGAKPAMTECAACHTGAARLPAPASDVHFDHATHAATSKQRACLACHGTPAIAAPDAKLVPSMLGCQTACHDGKRAFSATGTTCTRCHRGGEAPQRVAKNAPFSHAAHAARHVAIDDCSACHTLAADGTLLAPLAGKDHQPCASSGCHQSEFAAKAPAMCGVCHDAVSPSQKAVSRAAPSSAKAEWFTAIDHAAHLKGGTTNAACEQCHADQASHAACAPCHGKGQAPAMTACAACHLGNAPARALVSAWSVAATFKHETHTQDPRSHGTTACTACHTTVAAATDLAAIRAPAMATCDGCHDGKLAFKSTGFGCVRCHARQVP